MTSNQINKLMIEIEFNYFMNSHSYQWDSLPLNKPFVFKLEIHLLEPSLLLILIKRQTPSNFQVNVIYKLFVFAVSEINNVQL